MTANPRLLTLFLSALTFVGGCGDGSLEFDGDVWLVTDIPAPDLAPGSDVTLPDDVSENPDAPVNPQIAWCRLDGPDDLILERGQTATIGGRVWAPGLTDLSDATDTPASLRARLVIGPRNTSPASWLLTVDAAPDAAWDAAAADAPGRDRWLATLPDDLAVGDYDYAFAFSADGGAFWTYCDRNAGVERDGSEDGYAFDNAGKLVVYTDPCDPDPCATKEPTCDGGDAVTWAPNGTCTNPELVTAVCEHSETSRVDCEAAGLFCTFGACRADREPAPGELRFTELMLRPVAVSSSLGQWLEIHNTTDTPLNLGGLVVTSRTDSFEIARDSVVAASGRVVLGRFTNPLANGGVDVSIVIPDAFDIAVDGDTLSLMADDTVIARLNFGATGENALGLTPPSGASLQLAVDADDDGVAANWCAATTPYGSGDRGTPGAANTHCRFRIDHCRLEALAEPSLPPFRAFRAAGRYTAPGLTNVDQTGNDTSPLLRTGFAIVEADDDRTPDAWTWLPGDPDPDWAPGNPGFDANADAATRALAAPGIPGDYAVVFRVSGDGGVTWTLCDRDLGDGRDGSEDGFALGDAGPLHVTNPCLPNPCTVTPAPFCAGDTIIAPSDVGICTITQDAYACDHQTNGVATECPAYCAEGRCEAWRFADRAGDLVISEYLFEASLGRDATWVELHNPTPDPLNLRGLVLDTGGDAVWTVDSDTFVEPGAYFVLGASDDPTINGGVEVDAVWPDLTWDATSATLQLVSHDTLIDAVLGSSAWPRGLDVSTSMTTDALGAASPDLENDSANNWCLATSAYGDGAFGTPGAANSACAAGVQVIRTVPAANVDEVPVDGPLVINFSVPMRAETLTAQDYFGPCDGTIQLSFDNFASCVPLDPSRTTSSAGGSTVSIMPSPNLTRGIAYRWRITTDATSVNGVPLGETYATDFTTRKPFSCGGRPMVAISQVYGAGGNAGAVYDHDYVELHNMSTEPITLNGWSLRYAGATGVNWTSVTYLEGQIAPGGYFLVSQAGGTNGAELPTPDQLGTISLANASGKVVLLSGQGTSFPTDACPASSRVIDFVGYGTVNCAEGSQTTGAPSPSTANATWRDVAGCVDHNLNSTDFFAGPAAPRNSETEPMVCACNEDTVANDKLPPVGLEADYCDLFDTNTLQVTRGAVTKVFEGAVVQRGLTDVGDTAPEGLTVQIGYGRLAMTPTAQVDWAYVPALFRADGPNDGDTFGAAFVAPNVGAATEYRLTMRVSLDDGASWTWCDLDGAGADEGFDFSADMLPILKVLLP